MILLRGVWCRVPGDVIKGGVVWCRVPGDLMGESNIKTLL